MFQVSGTAKFFSFQDSVFRKSHHVGATRRIRSVVPVGGSNRASALSNVKGDFAARFAGLSDLLLLRQK
jgi:hypothetical protein